MHPVNSLLVMRAVNISGFCRLDLSVSTICIYRFYVLQATTVEDF